MPQLQLVEDLFAVDPLEMVEQYLLSRDLPYDQPSEDELVTEVLTDWCDLRIWLCWREDLQTLLFACSYGQRVQERQRASLYPLLAMVNERLWLGHFDLCQEEGIVSFRHSIMLPDPHLLGDELLSRLFQQAQDECLRFFPAIQSVLWAGKTAEEAFELAMFETVGEA